MYFFDLADYRDSCFFGPRAAYKGDSEDEKLTYRATRDAWLKALNEFRMAVIHFTNLDCNACIDCRDKIAIAFCNYQTYYNSQEYKIATALFFNMHTNWGLDPNTILYPDPDKKFGVQNYTYDEIVYSGPNCTGILSEIPQTISIDFGDGMWNQNVMNEYLRVSRKLFCLLDIFLKTATMNPQKSTLTNFVQIQ